MTYGNELIPYEMKWSFRRCHLNHQSLEGLPEGPVIIIQSPPVITIVGPTEFLKIHVHPETANPKYMITSLWAKVEH